MTALAGLFSSIQRRVWLRFAPGPEAWHVEQSQTAAEPNLIISGHSGAAEPEKPVHGAPEAAGADPSLLDGECCGRCRFAGVQTDHPDLLNSVTCRRSAPTIYQLRGVMYSGWPSIAPTDWCGEYESRVTLNEGLFASERRRLGSKITAEGITVTERSMRIRVACKEAVKFLRGCP